MDLAICPSSMPTNRQTHTSASFVSYDWMNMLQVNQIVATCARFMFQYFSAIQKASSDNDFFFISKVWMSQKDCWLTRSVSFICLTHLLRKPNILTEI